MSDKKRIYTVPVRYVFRGEFKIQAASKAQAEEYAEKHCGLVLGGDIHSSLPDEMVNWDFPVHPEKIVGHGRSKKKKNCISRRPTLCSSRCNTRRR